MNEGNTKYSAQNIHKNSTNKKRKNNGERYDGGDDGGGRSRLFYNRKNNIY